MALAIAIAFQATIVSSQSIWSNPITGNNPGQSNPYTAGDVADPNITVSGIGRGSGVNGANANSRYNTSSLNTMILDSTAYISFTLTPNTGYEIDFTNFTFDAFISGTGPTEIAIRSSVDNFTNDIYSSTGNAFLINVAVPLNNASFQNVTGPIEFRMYLWNASSANGTFGVDNFTFNGSVQLATPTLITFEEYKAVKKENASYLSWKLGGTNEGEKIGIQHSTDGNSFTTLAVVDQEISSFVHENPSKGANYYRLQSIALDGKKNYSKTHVLLFNNNREETTLYPNPAAHEIRITNNGSTIKSVTIHHVTGAMMIRSSNETVINIAELANGIYTATVTLANGNVEQHRFTIVK